MIARVEEVAKALGEGWTLRWGETPVGGVYMLKEAYMWRPEDVEPYCKRPEKPIVIYIVVSVEGLDVVYSRVRPGPLSCPVATFVKKYRWSDVRTAVKSLVEFITRVERIPYFQLNPELLRLAGLCDEYPLVCDDPFEVIRRVAAPRGGGARRLSQPRPVLEELVKVLRERLEFDASFEVVVRRVVEDPERLRACYA